MSFFILLFVLCIFATIFAVSLDYLLTPDISQSSMEEDNDNGF